MSALAHLLNPRAEVDPPRTCSILYIRRETGQTHYKERRLVTYVTLLIAEHGFPAPLPALVGGKLTTRVTTGSEWLRDAVDQWLDDYLPPRTAAAMLDAAQESAAKQMDASASNLRLVRGGKP